jgi:hypothetical protein
MHHFLASPVLSKGNTESSHGDKFHHQGQESPAVRCLMCFSPLDVDFKTQPCLNSLGTELSHTLPSGGNIMALEKAFSHHILLRPFFGRSFFRCVLDTRHFSGTFTLYPSPDRRDDMAKGNFVFGAVPLSLSIYIRIFFTSF